MHAWMYLPSWNCFVWSTRYCWLAACFFTFYCDHYSLFKFLFISIKYAYILSASLTACQLAIRPSCTGCMATDFLHKKVIISDLWNCCSTVCTYVYPLHHGVYFYPSLLNFHLKIAYRKVRNLQISIKKLSINLLCHT